MIKIKTINFELIRKGPTHNSLLSPLTDYLCLCGNYGATTVKIPWEHEEFMPMLSALRYPTHSGDEFQRQHSINTLAKTIADIFASSSGLQKSLHSESLSAKADGSPKSLTHLRLIISAAELALLPYELSKTISDLQGHVSQEWLSIQVLDPVCITRQIRHINNKSVKWPIKPKILLVAASPIAEVPLVQHIQALMSALMPWLNYNVSIDATEQEKSRALEQACAEYLTILPQANIKQVKHAIQETHYTHIHILAHGEELKTTNGKPYGIVLHDIDDPNKPDIVSGSRFCTAISDLSKHQLPSIVTVASCDSGHVNSVTHSAGTSFAHDLHQAGIALVVASQFPLTFAGSTTLVEHVYGDMLWGKSPLEILYKLRCELYSHQSHKNHDWASLIVYENLPDDLEQQLEFAQYKQTRAAIDKILNKIDFTINSINNSLEENNQAIEQDFNQATLLFKRFPANRKYESEVLGLKGSYYKRKAELQFQALKDSSCQISELEKTAIINNIIDELKESLSYYQKATENQLLSNGDRITPSSIHWLITQSLVLMFVLGEKFHKSLWHIAHLAAETDLKRSDGEIWAHGSLAELYLLRILNQSEDDELSISDAKTKSIMHIKRLKTLAKESGDDFPISSTKKQLNRYLEWWLSDLFLAEKPADYTAEITAIHQLHKLL